MSLDYRLSDIDDYQNLCWLPTGKVKKDGNPELYMNPVTHALIFLQMPILMGRITEKNYVEVFRRISMYEQCMGAFVSTNKGGYFITLQDVKDHIGLWTNVFEDTFPKFKKELMMRLERYAADEIRSQLSKMEEGA